MRANRSVSLLEAMTHTKETFRIGFFELKKENKKLRAALKEIERRGPMQHFEYYHLAQEALK